MKQPSDTTRSWIQQIQETFSDRPGNTPSANAVAHWVDGITRIGVSGDWPAIPYVVPYLASSESKISEAAAQALQNLVMNMRPTSLVELDDRLRGGMWSIPTYLLGWDQLQPNQAKAIIGQYQSSAIAGLLSFHRNGHVRQCALAELADIRTGRELPFLLIRLTDWVKPVYALAAREVVSRITNDYVYHFIDNLTVLQRVAARERGEQRNLRAQIIADIEDLLLRPENRAVMIESLKHPDPNVRRYVLKLLSIVPGDDLGTILRAAVHDSDIRNRRMVLNSAERLPVADRIGMLQQMLKQDPAPALRRDALQQLVDLSDDSDSTREMLLQSLSDLGAAVREYARWRLSKEGSVDVRQYYLEALSAGNAPADADADAPASTSLDTNATPKPSGITPKRLAAIISGLGEIGTRIDSDALAPFLDHKNICVRKAAIQSVARLNPKDFLPRFYELIASEQPGLSKSAMLAIQTSKLPVECEILWEAFQSTTFAHVQRNVVRLLNEAEKWDRLTYLLMVVASGSDGDVRDGESDSGDNDVSADGTNNNSARESAVNFIETWVALYGLTWRFTLPMPQQRERYLEAVKNSGTKLPVALSMQIPKSF